MRLKFQLLWFPDPPGKIVPGRSENVTGISVSLVPRPDPPGKIVPGGSGNETGMSAEVGLYVHEEVAGSYLMMNQVVMQLTQMYLA